ncbi:MAG: YebC/PmpR family DNA-binding transcriptional regulator, partial [Gammaproteobacteria bacterium]|nr:YebC/PmpR family DNA-binding transcriptional regulator [Gammaproteobacteria bacterium]
ITMRAATQTSMSETDAEKLLRLLENLEDLDDVQEVYSNADFPEDLLAAMS